MLPSKKVLFLMSGSIACYKACQVISRLVQAGHEVQVVATPSALQFVGAATLEGLSGREVLSDLWQKGHAMDHIHLIRDADLILAAPATAHLINRMAHGLGDDLMTTLFLAHDFKKPFLLAPAMNTTMYFHPTTQESLGKLRQMGVEILETASGVLACGETGFGKLLDPDLILKEVLARFAPKSSDTKVLITAGGTREKIDDVRVISNLSTGRSGARLADQFARLGMDVTFLHGENSARPTTPGIQQISFGDFADLEKTMKSLLDGGQKFTHVVQMAAISDYTVEDFKGKIPSGQDSLTLKLHPTPKLIQSLKKWSPGVKVAGFKLTSHASDQEQKAAVEKVLPWSDLVVQNDLAEMDETKGVHPYRLFREGKVVPLKDFNEMSTALSSWIFGKDLL